MNEKIKSTADEIIRKGRVSSRDLLKLSEEDCNQALQKLATLLEQRTDSIVAENQKDLDSGKTNGLSEALLDRLALNPLRISAIAAGVRAVISLRAPLGEELSYYESPKGISVKRVRVPLGLICIIFESRPNVTIETAILALKSRNAIILKGGKEAKHSNAIFASLIHEALRSVQLNADAVQLLGTDGRQIVSEIIQIEDGVDLVIPRGGESLIRAISAQSRVPVLKHYKGVCHVYVDDKADLCKALPIVVNAKCQRPSVCNAMETLLVHSAVAETFLPKVGEALLAKGVEIRGDNLTRALIPDALTASDEDWKEEYLSLTLAIKVVESLDEAIAHVNRYGSRHTEAILSEDEEALHRFATEVDAGSVMLNTSTRFADGFEYGLGAELGISTDKLHARGPMGLEGLTTYKWITSSDGAIRE